MAEMTCIMIGVFIFLKIIHNGDERMNILTHEIVCNVDEHAAFSHSGIGSGTLTF